MLKNTCKIEKNSVLYMWTVVWLEKSQFKTERMIKMRKNITTLTVACMALCLALLLSFASFAANVTLTDIEEHWAKQYIEFGVEKGYINGYTDNTFKPNKTVTRAEFSKMINSALEIKGASDTGFADVKAQDWFSAEVGKAQYAGYIKGYPEDNTFRPNNPISRQEAAVILSRIVLPTSKRASLDSFKDKKDIASWASDAISLIAFKGYMKGDQNGNVLPGGKLTRAEAAKLISEFVKNENVVNGAVTLDKTQTVSQTLFTDGVVIYCDDKAEINFDDCRVLGEIEIRTGEITLSLSNSVANSIVNKSEDDACVVVDKDSAVAVLTVQSPMLVKGDNVEKVVLDGENLNTGTVELEGSFALIDVNSSAIIKADGKLEELNINKKSDVIVQDGAIVKLTVNKAADNSSVNLTQKVTVNEVVNMASASYKGLGTIQSASNATGTTVTFETQPKSVTQIAPDVSGDSSFGANGELDTTPIAMVPANKVEGVSVSSNITLTFPKVLVTPQGQDVTASYVQEKIELRKETSSGDPVPFDVALNTAATVVTMTPKSELDYDTKYYIIVPNGAFCYADGNSVVKRTSCFYTQKLGEDAADDITGENQGTTGGLSFTISPKNKETGVEANQVILLTFDEKVLDEYGDKVTAAYVEEEIEIRRGSENGNTVSFSAVVPSSGNKISLILDNRLESQTKYYIIIPYGTFKNSSGEKNAKTTSYFTTGTFYDEDDVTVTFSPYNGETRVEVDEEIVIDFSQRIYTSAGNDVDRYYVQNNVELRRGSSDGTLVNFNAQVSSTGRKITITPTRNLVEGTTYYVIIPSGVFEYGDDNRLLRRVSYFTTYGTSNSDNNYDDEDDYSDEDELFISVYPADAAKNVAPMPDVVVTFSEPIVKLNGGTVTDSFAASDVVKLRYSYSTGYEVECDVSVSSDERKITLTPRENLYAGGTYYVVVNEGIVKGKYSKVKNDEFISYFNVASTNTPIITPDYGQKGVPTSTDVTISFLNGLYSSYDYYDASKRVLATAQYIKDNELITLRRERTMGEIVPCDYTVSGGGTVTLKPNSGEIKLNAKYYIVVKGDKLYTDTGYYYSATNSYFSTNVGTIEPKLTPADGAENVALNADLTITFDEPIYHKNDGTALSIAYLKSDVVKLYEGTEADGTLITDIDIKLSSDRTKITITPKNEFESNSQYTLVVVESTLKNENGEYNSKGISVFDTESVIDTQITFDPVNGRENVPLNVHPEIRFGTKILKSNGKPVDADYASQNIYLCKGYADSRYAVSARISITDDKIFTIIPDKDLEVNTTYYIMILNNAFVYNDENKTPVYQYYYSTSYFTTVKTMPTVESVKLEEAGENTVKLTYKTNTEGRIKFELVGIEGTGIDDIIDVPEQYTASGEQSITISGLKPGTKYRVYASITFNGLTSSKQEFAIVDTKPATVQPE